MEAIEARLSRVGITSLQELQIAVRGKTLAEMLQRSGKPLSQEVLSALVAAAEGLVDGSLGELPRDRTKEERVLGGAWVWVRESACLGESPVTLNGDFFHLDPARAPAAMTGPIFSFGLSGRDPVGKQKIPGPGAYELAKDREAGLTASKWTMTPRRERQKVGDVGDLPGPGDYEIEAMVGKSPKYSAGQKIDIGKKQVLPGPGDYSQGDITASKTPSWRFGTSNRARPNGAAEMTPGPGAYMVSSTAQPSFHKAYLSACATTFQGHTAKK
ncbi:unnamed protein product [Durusdinium trenchii]|uniref:Uncharacterized protein n=1 Tax=Durusdinium trenchii TaxID=1381693 RepID=A0ABP0ILC2_9DINO